MKFLKFMAAFCCCFISLVFYGQEKWSRIKIHIPSQNADKAKKFIFNNMEADHFTYEGDAIIMDVPASRISLLQTQSYNYEVVVDDLVQDFISKNKIEDFYANDKPKIDIRSRTALVTSCVQVSDIISTPASFTAGSMGGYYTLAEMEAKMDALVTAYPGIVSKFSIGKSVENRDIWCVKISDNVATDENEPEVLYMGLQHAREAISGASMMFFMQYLAENFSSNTKVNRLVSNREIFIIPCVNPDGYEYNRSTNPSGGGMWRKNRQPYGSGVYGTDLNRNWGMDWANCPAGDASCGSNTKSSETYWGTAAFSEPETQAIRDFVYARNFVTAVDQHCYGFYFSLPFGRPSLHSYTTDEQNFYTYGAALMGLYNCHRAGNSPQSVGYEVAGGVKDWLLRGDIGTGSKQKIYGLTSEAGGSGFWAATSKIIPLSRELCAQNLEIAYMAGSYVDVQDLGSLALTATTGNLGFQIRRIGMTDEPVTISVIPLENIQSVGTPVTVNSITNYHDSYSGNISYTLHSSVTNGKRIRFAWKVETGGIITYDTITKFYNPLTLLSDNMEGSLGTNWSVPSGGSASNKWGLVSGTAYSGTKSLTESMSGDYPAATTRYVDYNSTFNLSDATAAYLSFWVRHRAENCNDKLQIQVSTNGTTYVPLCGKNTIAENNGTLAGKPALTGIRENWTRELFDLSDYLGTTNLRLRFEFTSNTDASSDDFYKKIDDGFYIDDVMVMKSTGIMTVLPVKIVHFSGKLLENRTVQLYWEAYTTEDHDYFEIERSDDGMNFTAIGITKKQPPYYFTDLSPKKGDNFYRIKQYDKDGKFTYSTVINIVLHHNFSFTVFPNPVTDNLIIKLNGNAADNLKMQLTDVSGRIVLEEVRSVNAAPAEIKLNVAALKPQVYILKITNSKDEVISTQKIIKK